jgi:tRNA (mo5U34)-methyltransferase
MILFDRELLFTELNARGLDNWAKQLRLLCDERYSPTSHGDYEKWKAAVEALPDIATQITANHDAVEVNCDRGQASGLSAEQLAEVRSTLMQLHPWRKGPFKLFDLFIDTEWRSDLKWKRLERCVDFTNKLVLDIGCGNGYYGWKMVDRGAEMVIGCDPTLLYNFQYEAVRRYAPVSCANFLVPVADHELPEQLGLFDITVSMGVLYHRTSPIDHLFKVAETLKTNGQLLLETLVIDASDARHVLVPEGRYAKMRNVWFIPSLALLRTWLTRTGFTEIEVVDVTATTIAEQRQTEWMRYESLADFLDPHDSSLTIEGHPAPLRAMLLAKKR